MIFKKDSYDKSVPMRVGKPFDEEIKDIMRQRIKHRIDDPLKPMKAPDITAALSRHELWDKIKQDAIKRPIKKLGEFDFE